MLHPDVGHRFHTAAAGVVAIALTCLCTTAWSQQVATQDIAVASAVVERLRALPTPLPIVGNGPSPVGQRVPILQSEVVRDDTYRELHRLASAAVIALARAYSDDDVRLRRNVALAFVVLSEGIWPGLNKLDVSLALPELTSALRDDDPDVRAWSAHAIAMIGPAAQSAVPALIRLLRNADEGSRNSACIGLRGIGPAAGSALPALRRALSDPSADVRKFAHRAILAIEG